jgi:hypothetical protein
MLNGVAAAFRLLRVKSGAASTVAGMMNGVAAAFRLLRVERGAASTVAGMMNGVAAAFRVQHQGGEGTSSLAVATLPGVGVGTPAVAADKMMEGLYGVGVYGFKNTGTPPVSTSFRSRCPAATAAAAASLSSPQMGPAKDTRRS